METTYHPAALESDKVTLRKYLESLASEDCVNVVESPAGSEGVRIIVITAWGVGV